MLVTLWLCYASIFVAILLIGLPAAMAWVIRRRQGSNHCISKLLLIFILSASLAIIGLEMATIANVLPRPV